MRILDQETQKSLSDIILLLTKDEASELKDELERLLSSKDKSDHAHINDEEYSREITLAIYDMENLDSFENGIRRLIEENR